MMHLLAQSPLPVAEVLRRCELLDIIILDPACVQSIEELELAHHLAKKSFDKKSNIASKFKYEFLLWLTGKTDIKSAMAKSKPKDNKKLFIVSFEKEKSHLLDILEASEIQATFVPRATALQLEEISLSRVRN